MRYCCRLWISSDGAELSTAAEQPGNIDRCGVSLSQQTRIPSAVEKQGRVNVRCRLQVLRRIGSSLTFLRKPTGAWWGKTTAKKLIEGFSRIEPTDGDYHLGTEYIEVSLRLC